MAVIGAKRALHFARRTAELGWRPVVITLPAGEKQQDPALRDHMPAVPVYACLRGGPLAWLEDWRRKTKQTQTANGSPKFYTAAKQAPPQRHGWAVVGALDRYAKHLPWGVAPAWVLARRHRCRAIYVNVQPVSGMILGAFLQRVTGLPLIVDMRDPWAWDPNTRPLRSAQERRFVDAVERWCLGRAQRIVLNTEATLKVYRQRYDGVIPTDRFTCIRNHFDSALYDPLPAPPPADDPFVLMFYGHLRADNHAAVFLQGYRRFIDHYGLRAGQTRFFTFGQRTLQDRRAIAALDLESFVASHPWVPFTQCRRVLGRAHLLVDITSPRRSLQIAGKVYDYLACRRPILSISANPEVGRILKQTQTGRRTDHDPQAIAEALGVFYERRFDLPQPSTAALETFGAAHAGRRLVALLETITGSPL
jgi:hypothetical protein